MGEQGVTKRTQAKRHVNRVSLAVLMSTERKKILVPIFVLSSSCLFDSKLGLRVDDEPLKVFERTLCQAIHRLYSVISHHFFVPERRYCYRH